MPVETVRSGLARADAGGAADSRILVLVGGSAALAASLEEPGRVLIAAGAEGAASHAGVRALDGAAGDAATYAGLPEAAEVSAVVALDGPADAAAAVRAIHAARPDAVVLVLGEGARPKLPRSPLVRYLDERAVRERRIHRELERLALVRHVRRLRAFAAGVDVLPLLIQRDPDPDALASALAVRVLLRRGDADAPIVSRGENRRPENRRMAELLGLQVTHVTEEELRRFEALIAIDMQPEALGGDGPRVAVIDHHPLDGAPPELADIRPEIGATATILTEYLRADDPRRVRRRLATALLYGIRTDTDSLRRGTTRADVLAYAFLQERADLELLEKIQQPSRSAEAMRGFGAALEGLVVERDVAAAFLGRLPDDDAHLAPDLADLCLTVEGTSWVVVGMIVGEELSLTVRHKGGGVGAGALAERLAGETGAGGGHATMARAVVSLEAAGQRLGGAAEAGAGDASAAGALLGWALEELEALG